MRTSEDMHHTAFDRISSADGCIDAHTRTSIKTILERDQRLVYKGNGNSMLPMLRPDRDMIVFAPVKERLKKYDVALYVSGKNYVAHRVIKVQENGYLIRGDNTYAMETVAQDAVIGVLTHFTRDGKQYHVTHKGYRFYAVLWCALYPVRFGLRKGMIWTKRLLRKLG